MRTLRRLFPSLPFHHRNAIDRCVVQDNQVIASGHIRASTTPADMARRCSNCNSDFSAEDLDLESVAKYFNQEKIQRSWKESAEGGCTFCRLIVAVQEDAEQRYGGDWSRRVNIGLTRDKQYFLSLLETEMALPHTIHGGVHATITVYLKDSRFPDLLERYKPVPQQAIDPACLNLAKQWLSTCQNGHEQCDEKFDTAGPSRLIDLRGEVIKLVLAPEESVRGSYVALSHCWGDSQLLRTTLESLASFQEQISDNDLPQTFSDAIYVARALGFSHIWIDSLCIIQDDRSDWEQQSSIMASIYSNANLVLAGAAAGSANEGFLRKSRPSYEGSFSLDIRGSQTSFAYRAVPEYHDSIGEPLYQRGWTLQERLCARRFLAYGNWEMSWECKRSSCCEHHAHNLDNDSTSQQVGSFGAMMETTSPQDFAQLWRTYVAEPYSQRLLTKATDVPVAISALADRFQSRFQGTYLAGLWKEDLHKDLLWWSSHWGHPSSFSVPSWSWMSLQLPHRISFYDESMYGVVEETLVYNMQTEVTPSTTNPYGPISSGTIRLIGKLIPASLKAVPPPRYIWGAKLSTLRRDISSSTSWIDTYIVPMDVRLMNRNGEITTRRAARQEESSSESYPITLLPILINRCGVTGLLLERSATCVGAYERIGILDYLSKSEFEYIRKDYDVCNITLV